MPAALLPRDESDRLQALRRYGILDTEAEELFDSVARIAATICDTPISLVSLIDADRQWFKAKIGLETSQTPRELAFCAHAILRPEELLVVPDATLDPRFRDNPLVTGSPDIRFYAGAPILTHDHQPLGTLCVIDTQPRQLSPRQVQALEHLAKQVQANLDLRLKTRQLNDLNESKNRFFSILAHDLRAPLGTIVSIADLLTDPEMPFEEAEQKKFLQHLKTSARTTSQIAENLLSMALFEKGALKFAPAHQNIPEIVESARSATSGALAAKSIDFSLRCPPDATAWADPSMLHSILQNLLSNAAKFTPERGSITVTVATSPTTCAIAVDDTGVGIKPEILSRIFKLESTYSTPGTAGEKGSGLGLTLCRQFARQHGGDLTLASTPGQGATATLTLPAAP